MWFKRKEKTLKFKEPTDKEVDRSAEYAKDLLYNILPDSGDGIHLLTISVSGMEDIEFIYGRIDPELYNYGSLDLIIMRIAMRIHVFKGCMITLQSFDDLDPKEPSPEVLKDEIPNKIRGWLIKDLDQIPLTAQQIFDFWYSDEEKSTKEYLDEKAVLQSLPENPKGKVLFLDAWDLK